MWRLGVDRTTAKRVSTVTPGVKTHKDTEYLTVLLTAVDSGKKQRKIGLDELWRVP